MNPNTRTLSGQDLINVLAQYPTVEFDGFVDPATRPHLEDSRRLLAEAVDEFDAACSWIRDNLLPQATVNRRFSSYHLKHLLEAQTGVYTSNGAFILALAACGYTVVDGDLDGYANVTTASVRAAQRRAWGR